MTGRIRVSEIFGPTIQGEGPLIGRLTVFVRTGGCDYRCDWCDTLYAVLPEHRAEWTPMTAAEIMARVEERTGGRPALISLSGGNPALQPLGPLVELGRRKGHAFALETQGSAPRPWFGGLEWLILSPKPPSSAMATDWAAFDACLAAAGDGPRCALKLVVFDERDYAFARAAADRHPHLPLYLQVGNHTPARKHAQGPDAEPDLDALMRRYRWLISQAAADHWFAATVLPQLHVLVWGNQRGV